MILTKNSVPLKSEVVNSTPVSRPKRRKDGPALLKSGRVNKTRSGEVYDRSVPMTRDDSRRFATALAALPGFRAVAALSTKHTAAEGRTWFVRWHRDEAIAPAVRESAMQNIRLERAAHQAREMEWFLAHDEDTASTTRYCLHYYPDSDAFGLYLVDPHGCNCPDHQYRLAGSGLSCKHMNALRMHLKIPVEAPKGIYADLPREQVKALLCRDRDLDFP
jgi:hypothetical protein